MNSFKEKLNYYGSKKEPFSFIISYDLKKYHIEKLEDNQNRVKFSINNKARNILKNYTLEKYPEEFSVYKRKFDFVQDEMNKGALELVNLTTKTKIKTDLTLDEIYTYSNSLLKLRVKIDDLDFVCFSPEKFVEIIDNKIYTYPMKGTIDSKIEDAKELLLNDVKEIEEHQMVVKLLQKELKNIAKNIKVDKFRYIDKIKSGDKELLQTSSKISGELEDEYMNNIADIVLELLPAASITGIAKDKSIEIINNIEEYDRGFYSGVFGVYDGFSFQSFVLIRFIEKIEEELYFKSGGGVTKKSVAEDEYEELISKIYFPF